MQSETLAQEFARLVKEYHEGDDHTKPEAWNLLADYAVDNADAISAALSDKQAVEVEVKPLEWRCEPRRTFTVGNDFRYEILYFQNDTGCGWELIADEEYSLGMFDHLPLAIAAAQADYEQRIRSALVDVPAIEPVAWRWESAYGGEDLIGQWQVSTVKPSRSEDATAFVCEPLYTRPPLSREGEDSAEVVEGGAKILAKWIGYAWDGLSDRDISAEYKDWAYNGIGALVMQGGKPALRKVAASILALAATRSGSATTAKGISE